MMFKIIIPDNLSFSDLELSRDQNGLVSFNSQVIEQVCDFNELNCRMLFELDENAAIRLIVMWYAQHLAAGGAIHVVAEDLITKMELN